MIGIMICDDLYDICDFFSKKINSQEDMEVLCVSHDAQSSIDNAIKYKPNIILMDIQMDEYCSGIIATKKIMEELPATKIIMLTIHNSDELIVDSYVAGAVDYIIKDSPVEEICNLIRKVYNSSEFLGRTIANVLYKYIKNCKNIEPSINYTINYLLKLTPVEVEIVKMLCKKKKRKEIAKEKELSENTVKQHIRHILKKLNFESTSKMIDFLEELDIMDYL